MTPLALLVGGLLHLAALHVFGGIGVIVLVLALVAADVWLDLRRYHR